MVLIEPPAEEAATAVHHVGPPPLPKATAPPAVPAEPEQHVKDLADTVEDPTLYGTLAAPLDDVLADEFPVEPLPDAQPAPFPPTPSIPADEWQAESSAAWKRWILTALAGAAGIALAVLLVGWLTSSGDVDRGPQVNAASSRAPAHDPPNKPAGPADGSAGEPSPLTNPADASDAAAATSPTVADVGETETPGEKPADTATSVESSNAANPGAEKTGTDAAVPPGFTVPETKPESESAEPAASLRDTLKAFGILMDATARPEKPTDDGSPPEASGIEVPRPEPLNIDVDARLNDPIVQIDFNEVPLIDFLDFISDYSTIPITLDPDVLPWLGKSPDTPISTRLEKTTVGGLLNKALATIMLGFVVTEDQLLVTRATDARPPVRKVTIELADLAGSDKDQVTQIANLVRALIVPESWDTGGGIGTMHVQDTALVAVNQEVVLYEVLGFCEKLRVARGLPPSRKRDPSLLQLTPRSEQAQSRLQTPVSLNFFRPERFNRVVRRLGKATDTYVLIDWRSAADMGWNPSAEVQFVAAGTSLAEALRTLLEPMGLTYRIVNERTFQVVSRERLNSRMEVEFYPVADLLGGGVQAEQLLAKAKTALGERSLRDDGGSGTLSFYAPANVLIAALVQPQQQKLAKTLAQWRGGTAKP
jgi:hypothetical protein